MRSVTPQQLWNVVRSQSVQGLHWCVVRCVFWLNLIEFVKVRNRPFRPTAKSQLSLWLLCFSTVKKRSDPIAPKTGFGATRRTPRQFIPYFIGFLEFGDNARDNNPIRPVRLPYDLKRAIRSAQPACPWRLPGACPAGSSICCGHPGTTYYHPKSPASMPSWMNRIRMAIASVRDV